MILFIIGPPGIGKTSCSNDIVSRIGAVHLELEAIRHATGAQTTTNPLVEDAVNWRVFEQVVKSLKKFPGRDIIVDSTGASRRFSYLRYALGDIPQLVIRLGSAYAFSRCTRKWGSSYSQSQFDRINSMILEVPADLDFSVDGNTSMELATIICERMAAKPTA